MLITVAAGGAVKHMNEHEMHYEHVFRLGAGQREKEDSLAVTSNNVKTKRFSSARNSTPKE